MEVVGAHRRAHEASREVPAPDRLERLVSRHPVAIGGAGDNKAGLHPSVRPACRFAVSTKRAREDSNL